MAQISPQNHIEVPESSSIAKLFALIKPEAKLVIGSFIAGFIVATLASEALESRLFGTAFGIIAGAFTLERIATRGSKNNDYLAYTAGATGYMLGVGTNVILRTKPSSPLHVFGWGALVMGALISSAPIIEIWPSSRRAMGQDVAKPPLT